MKITTAITAFSCLFASIAKPQAPSPVTVYTTAQNTGNRLTQTGVLEFRDFGQPLETQVCAFVDPSHSFQTMLGIDLSTFRLLQFTPVNQVANGHLNSRI